MKLTLALSFCLILGTLVPAAAIEESTVCLRLAQNKESMCNRLCQSSYNEDAKTHCIYKCDQERSATLKICDTFGSNTIKSSERVDVAKPD